MRKLYSTLPAPILSAVMLSLVMGVSAFAGVPAPPPPTSTVCVQDETTSNFITWNTTTGAYNYVNCSMTGVASLTGTGKVRLVNGMQTLTDNQSNRRISAAFLTGQLTGSATIVSEYSPGLWQTTTLHDTMPGAPCACVVESGGSNNTLWVFVALVFGWLTWSVLRLRRARIVR